MASARPTVWRAAMRVRGSTAGQEGGHVEIGEVVGQAAARDVDAAQVAAHRRAKLTPLCRHSASSSARSIRAGP
jgi:hypothetical protein